MSDVFFTSDNHYGHDRIIQFCKRPFTSSAHMNSVMVKNWNSVVKPNDIVYNLGDFSLKQSQSDIGEIIYRLNGHINFIEGNHDRQGIMQWLKSHPAQDKVTLLQRWEAININSQEIFMSHYAQRSWHHDLRGTWHIFGHTHNELPPYGKSCDVGVDAWDFTPVSFEQLKDKMDKRPIGNHPGFKDYDPKKATT